MSHASIIQLLTEALARHRDGKLAEAVRTYESMLQIDPTNADAMHGLGLVALQLGQAGQAIHLISLSIASRPAVAHFHANLGLAQKANGDLASALKSLHTAIRLDPGRASHHANVGVVHHARHELAEAAEAYKQSLALDGNLPDVHSDLAIALQAQGLVDDAIEHLRRALSLRPTPATESNLLLAMHYSGSFTPREQFDAHLAWSERHAHALIPQRLQPPSNHHKLRMGFVSADLRSHPVASFLEPYLRHYDRGRFEVTCYADSKQPDGVTARLRSLVDHWRPTAVLSDEALVTQIRADEFDILIDLAGHTANTRLLAFARRPAPLQATWIGYPNTTGVNAINLRITDAIADPHGNADTLHAERLLRLPNHFLCWQPPADAPAVAAPPASNNGYVTFGSFNNLAKLSRDTLETWAAVLTRVPGSQLLVKAPGMTPAAEARIRVGMSSIEPKRIHCSKSDPSYTAHLAHYSKIDISLDPFPYNGTTTVCEALWMGVPVVAKLGDAHVSRVAASLLSAAGMSSNIARDKTGYVDRAAALAADIPRMVTQRLAQREAVAASLLVDGERFVRDFETCLLIEWQSLTGVQPRT